MDYQINFPHLGIFLEHVGKEIKIGNFSIAYYGIVFSIAMIAGLFLTLKRVRETGQDEDDYLTITLFTAILSLIGSRTYYVVCNWDYYSQHPLSIINFREGGIGMYGGIIAGTLILLIFSKIKKIPFLKLCDTAALSVLLGQIIGRWGNFFNREAFGGYTDGLLAMQLPVSAVRQREITQEMWDNLQTIDGVEYVQVHPTFLYESLWNLGLFIILWKLRDKMKFRGEMVLWYFIGYGAGRFWIESLRTDQLLIPGTSIPISMVVAAVCVVGGLFLMILGRRRARLTGDGCPTVSVPRVTAEAEPEEEKTSGEAAEAESEEEKASGEAAEAESEEEKASGEAAEAEPEESSAENNSLNI